MIFRTMSVDEIRYWYTEELSEAFAPNERKPLQDILMLQNEGRYELWGLFDAAQMAGYATIWKAPGIALVLLDYLGVSKRLRNGGLGSDILSRLRAQGRPIVTEAELPVTGGSESENDIRRRRIGFYIRNGFSPVYEMATCGMRWQALVYDEHGHTLGDIMRWHKALYGPARTDVVVPLGPDEQPEMPYWIK